MSDTATDTYLLPSELKQLTRLQASHYHAATNDEKAQIAKEWRQTGSFKAPKAVGTPVGEGFGLKNVGLAMIILGLLGTLVGYAYYSGGYSYDMRPIWPVFLSASAVPLGFMMWLFGVIEVRLIEISAKLDRR